MGESILKAPDVTPFVECPNCSRLLEYGAGRCPFCYEEIIEDYAHLSAAAVTVNTQAVSLPNTISSVRPSACTLSFLMVFAYDAFVAEAPVLLFYSMLWPAVALTAITVWFVKYNWFKIGDVDFEVARREMSSLLGRWLGFLAIHFIGVALLWG